MATINGVTGNQYTKDTNGYEDAKYQYATSSYATEHRLEPELIVYPTNKNDIALALKYAKSQKVAVAIRTGGHQYSGASSTVAPNIQLNLSTTFRGPDDRRIFEADGQIFVRTSVSWSLGEFNKYLGQHQLFVPHGQCINVHLGGHVQTGGYGQLGRSFGLFGDHVVSLEIVDHEGNIKEVTTATDKELFSAILGGSPGNLGVITHITIKVYRDQDYLGSRGLKSLYWYNPETLRGLLDILVEMSDDDNFSRNYDYCVSVISSSNELLSWVPDVDERMRVEHPEIYGKDGNPFWPRMIIVYAQWVPFAKTDVCDMGWFNRIRQHSLFDLPVKTKPMSELTAEWLFRNVREFDHPYVKSTHVTNSKTLATDGWASWVSERIDAIVKPEENRCWLSAQFQCFGGKNSKFTTNAGNGTSYSWRDTTICATLDCFYGPGQKQTAEDWHAINDQEAIGPNGKFSKQDRRVLWGSYGSYDLDASWSYYYEDRAKYDRLRKARSVADPDGVFTPNTFCVARQ
ncbi:putative FAD-linked oxidoreductase [Halenospora varia]|nr:putative FAD-linked oxidoreductase [Halenospora varia]